ncbi:MAG: hypothetical protein WD009_11995 [Phycisphaeraceae bacterium]
MWHVIVRSLLAAMGNTTPVTGPAGATAATATAGVPVAPHGRIAFIGLINNRPLTSVGQQEIRNAFAKIGLREAHNSHFVSRLIERGPVFGIRTLDDFARAINNGAARPGGSPGTVEIVVVSGRVAVVINPAGELVTFLPL